MCVCVCVCQGAVVFWMVVLQVLVCNAETVSFTWVAVMYRASQECLFV